MTRKPSDRSSHIALEPKRGKRPVQVLLASLVVVALCVAIRCYWPAAPANADPIDSAPAGNWDADRSDSDQNSPPVEQPNRQPPIRVARASTPATGLPGDRRNSQSADHRGDGEHEANRAQRLAAECLHRYGKEVLDSMINKQLIVEECQRQRDHRDRRRGQRRDRAAGEEVPHSGRTVAENAQARAERHSQAVRRRHHLADARPAEIGRPSAERHAGGAGAGIRNAIRRGGPRAADRGRQLGESEVIRAQAAANPHNFDSLAKNCSEDPSASAKGLIPPIRQHGSYQEIEDAVFHMANGEISQVIHVADQYLILKRENLLAAQRVHL